MESPANVLTGEHPSQEDFGSNRKQSLHTASDSGGQFIVMDAYGALVLHTGAAANLARNKSLEHHKKISERWRFRHAETHPACARVKFGAGC